MGRKKNDEKRLRIGGDEPVLGAHGSRQRPDGMKMKMMEEEGGGDDHARSRLDGTRSIERSAHPSPELQRIQLAIDTPTASWFDD